jgi:hypothetical protein
MRQTALSASDDCRMGERGGGHDRDPWEDGDDWFASPEPAGQGSGEVEENWFEEDADAQLPVRCHYSCMPQWSRTSSRSAASRTWS